MTEDIDEKIKAFAIMRKIPIEKLDEFDKTVRLGLKALGLKSDDIEANKYIAIARRRDAQLIAKKQGDKIGGENTEADNAGSQAGEAQGNVGV